MANIADDPSCWTIPEDLRPAQKVYLCATNDTFAGEKADGENLALYWSTAGAEVLLEWKADKLASGEAYISDLGTFEIVATPEGAGDSDDADDGYPGF